MFIFLSKVLPPLFMPPGLSLWLLVLGLALAGRGRRAVAGGGRGGRLGRFLVLIAILALWLPATPLVSDLLLRAVEDRYPVVAAAASPGADAIVLLGGGTSGHSKEQPDVGLGGSGGRLLHAFRLYKAGKAPLILLSGDGLSRSEPEAEQMRSILSDWGVPDSAMVLEPRSRNTHENAVECAAILGERGLRRVLLVTSAYHMPRSVALFRKEGRGQLEILPSPTGRLSAYQRPFLLLAVLPDGGALANSVLALREHLGLVVYQLKGWI